MSVYTQEVLGLLKRNKKKVKLDKIKDHFEFGKLYRNSTLNTGAVYNPTMEPFVIKWGDFKCATEEGMVRQDPTGTQERYITMWTDPVFQGDCNTATITKTIISQNDLGTIINIAGDTVIEGDLQVDQNANVNLQLTAGSANILDLTEDRIVIVGLNGELEDDANFTMDGTTFTANVNVIHGTDVPAGVPTHTTTINSNLKLEGPVYDSLGSVGGLNKVLVGLADGRVKWQDDDVVEALTYGSLWQGDPTNYKVELAIGTADQILISDGTTFSWQDNPAAIVGETCAVYRLPLWTPDSNTLGCSILIQDGNSTTPATKVTIEGETIVEGDLHVETNTFLEGNVEVNGTTKLDTLAQDDTLVQVLVRDVANDNLIKFRDASSIKPQVGFDTLNMLPDGWASTDGNFNAYVKLDDTTTAVKNIKDMDWLVDGDRVVVIAENVKTGTLLADNVVRFPSWQYPGGAGRAVSNFSSWNQSSIGSGWTGAIDNGYQTSTLLFGEKIKFKAEMYADPGSLNNQLNWDACCKIYSNNTCPTGSNGSTTINEDTSFSGSFNGIDDGYGGYGLTYSIVSGPSNGTVTLTDPSTGAFTYTPNTNYFGTDVITWEATDGYCTSNQYTFTITINAVDDAPVWTSTDPVTANTYPNLTGGDTWTYNWTVADADTPCASLTFPSQTIPAWLTFTNNGDCTGTLSGTFPNTGGTFSVQLNVSDGTSTASQSFEIGGLAVDNDTYFVNWFDGSGSMDTTGRILSGISSTPTVLAKSDGSGSGTTTLRLNPGVSNDVGMYVDDPSGDAFNGYELLVVGMTVSGTGIPAGTTIVTATAFTVTLSNNHTTSVGDIITFARTAAQKTADYNDISTFRNLLQDFYATGGVEGSPDFNTDPATNGANRYDTHVKFGWDAYSAEGNGERQIQYLANLGNPINRGAGQLFENASTVVIMAWGDESDNWYYNPGNPPTPGNLFTDKTSGNGLRVANDVADVQQFITTSETNAGSNQIYRGIWFSVADNTIYRQIGQGLQNGISPNSQFTGNWTNADLLTAQSSGSPTRIQYAGQTGDTGYGSGITANNTTAGYYRSVVLAKLQDSGFTTLT